MICKIISPDQASFVNEWLQAENYNENTEYYLKS